LAIYLFFSSKYGNFGPCFSIKTFGRFVALLFLEKSGEILPKKIVEHLGL
jgi:hypothetical protein